MRSPALPLNLNLNERESFTRYLMLLLEYDEPIAMLGALQRLAELKAMSVRRGKVGLEAAAAWERLAETLQKVRWEEEDRDRVEHDRNVGQQSLKGGFKIV